MLADFGKIEEHQYKKGLTRRSASIPSPNANQWKWSTSRWFYCVLNDSTLDLYARRADFKRKDKPERQIPLLLTPLPETPQVSVFGFDRACIYLRSKDTGSVLRLRLYQRKHLGRWVNTLYSKSLQDSHGVDPFLHSVSHESEGRKVEFCDEIKVSTFPRESFDFEDVYYSREDYAYFGKEMKKEGKERGGLMKSMCQKLSVHPSRQERSESF